MSEVHGIFLKRFQIIVPVADEFLVTPDIGRINPFPYLNFTLSGRGALMYLEEIPEGMILILPPKRKDPAEAGAQGMNAASPVR